MADLKAWAGSIVGKTIADRYDVSSVLGMGGNGGVFLASHMLLGDRAFAVKLIIPNPLAGPMEEQEQRLAREAATALTFVHPRAVQVRDFGFDRENGVMYMAMDYVEGTGLSALLAEKCAEDRPGETALELGRALRITRMILDVLETAETANVVHRDLKPSNIILTAERGEEDIKILDFGLAKVVRVARGQEFTDEDGKPAAASSQLLVQRLTASGAIMGTVQYMAPEQARGDAVDGRADIYSTGVILYEMLTGKLPHGGSNYHHLLFARATEPAVTVERARPDLDLPASVRTLLDRALAMRPDDRFQSAPEFAAAVEAAMAEAGVEPPAATVRASRRGSSVALPAQGLPVAGGAEGAKTPPGGPASERLLLRRRLVLAGLAAAGVLTMAAFILLAAIWPDPGAGLVAKGEERLRRGDVAGALEALEEADRAGVLEGAGLALLRKVRAAAALERAREAVRLGDRGLLGSRLVEARDLGADGAEIGALATILEAAGEVERAELLVGERSYMSARAVLAALPPGLPDPWAARARRLAESTERELARAAALLAAGRAPSPSDDKESLRAAADALERFLEGFPYHPSRKAAGAARDRFLERLEALKGQPAATPTGLRIDSRPAGLLCRLDDRVVGRTPFETSEGMEPGKHRIELVDADGFRSAHEVDVVRGRVAHYSFDHAAAVEPERSAFAKANAPGPRSPVEAARDCRRYLAGFPGGAMREEVAERLAAAERRAFADLELLRKDGAAPGRGIEAAEGFEEAFPDSARAGTVAAWLDGWRRVAREEAAERDSHERLDVLLTADGITADAREAAVLEHLRRFPGGGAEARAKAMLERHLVRPVGLPGRVVLAGPAGPGRGALALADPARLAILRLASGKAQTAALPPGCDVVALDAAPDGAEVFAATAKGRIVRWRPSSRRQPIVVAEEPVALTTLVALGGGRIVVADGLRPRALVMRIDDGGGVARADFAPTVRRPCRAARSADGRLVALADARGSVAVLAVGEAGATEILWRKRVRAGARALAFSPLGRLVAASSGDGGAGETVVLSVEEDPARPVARHRRSSDWLAVLDGEGLLLVGGVALGPAPGEGPVPLRAGAACFVDGRGGHLLLATAEGEAVVADLPALVRQVGRAREDGR